MGTLYLRGIPDELEAQVRKLAAQDRRSVNAEAIVLLERVVAEEVLIRWRNTPDEGPS